MAGVQLPILFLTWIGCAKEYLGLDCKPKSHQKDNKVTVGRKGDCLYLKDAPNTLDPGSKATVKLLDEYISGTVSITKNWNNLVIEPAGSADAPVVLTPHKTDVVGEAIISVTGNAKVTLNSGKHGLTIEGGGKHSGLQIEGAKVLINSVDFHHVVDGVVVRTEGEVAIINSKFDIVSGSAIFAGFQSIVTVSGADIRGIVPSSGPAIDSSDAAAIDVRASDIARWNFDKEVVYLDGDDLQFVGNYVFESQGGDSMFALKGGQARSPDGQVEKIHAVENNFFVDNTLGNYRGGEDAPAILRLDAKGEISNTNNTIANNDCPEGDCVVVDARPSSKFGTTVFVNNTVADNLGFSEMLLGTNDEDDDKNSLVINDHNVYFANFDSDGSPTLADIDPEVNNNVNCDPEFLLYTSAPDPYPFSNQVPKVTDTMYDEISYLNPDHYNSDPSNFDCTSRTGDKDNGHNNPGKNYADIGARGGAQANYSREAAKRMLEEDDWFGVD